MTRPFRKGDRVTATGMVVSVRSLDRALIQFEGGLAETALINTEDLALIEPAEPPVGSVVVKDGVAWVRQDSRQTGYGPDLVWVAADTARAEWRYLSDGDIIFTPGGDA